MRKQGPKPQAESERPGRHFSPEPWERLIAELPRISTRAVRVNLAEVLQYVSRGDAHRVILTKNGEERCAIVSIYGAVLLEALAKHPEIQRTLKDVCPELRQS